MRLYDATARLVPVAGSEVPVSTLQAAMRKAQSRHQEKLVRIALAYRVFATETTAKKVAVSNPARSPWARWSTPASSCDRPTTAASSSCPRTCATR